MHAEDDLLEYYKRELAYLKNQGADFARRYPKVANRLAFHGTESLDPHTERLIEANAFLAARVHRDLDREFPKIATELLEQLCPSLMQPVPSMSVAGLELDATQGKVTAGYLVPRHTSLVVRSTGSEVCRLRTAWDTVLWPLRIADVRVTDGACLRIQIQCLEGIDLQELSLERLQFHLFGDWMNTMPLYELLVSAVVGVSLVSGSGQTHTLPLSAWRELGYARDEAVLPNPLHAAPAYGLMQEYFTCPRKFHFFEIQGLAGRLGSGRQFELRLQLDRSVRFLRGLDAQSFRLGCVPVINLFTRTSEPLTIDHRQHEYMLVADHQHESTTEIHSIVSVVASDPNADRPIKVPAFAAQDTWDARDGVFWTARREASLRKDISGTDMFLSFVDPHNAGVRPAQPVVYAQLLCTNRRLAEQISAGTLLRAENISSAPKIVCLYEPSPQRDPPLNSATLWKLVSLLRLNHQSLVDGSNGIETLRDMLALFASDSARDLAQIRGLRSLQAHGVTARLGTEAWRGYCRGTEVVLSFDEEAYAGGSPLLLAAVLARFFALYTTINSFVRLKVRRGDEDWKQWAPMSGYQHLI